MRTKHEHNGTAFPVVAVRHPRRFSADLPDPEDAQKMPGGFTLRDTERLAVRPRLPLAHQGVFLGSTGSLVGHLLCQKILRELGRLPGPYAYLMVDAANPPAGADPHYFCQLGDSGFGTDPENGRLKIAEHYFHLRSVLRDHLERTASPDPVFVPQFNPREILNVWIVGGCGGTSGGGLQTVVNVVHDFGQLERVADLRVHLVLLGPDMPMRDKTRRTIPEQRRVVQSTAAANLWRTIAEMTGDGLVTETRPDGTTFTVPAARRFASLTFVDQCNGKSQFSTTAGLAAMLADALFLRLFTDCNSYLFDRLRDYQQLGALGTPRAEKETE
jgi:hypothetical protein